MNPELNRLADQLHSANKPEDIFGDLTDGTATPLLTLRWMYLAMAKITHPDVYQDIDEKQIAQTAFPQLVEWFHRAEQKIQAGQYGKADQIILKTKTREYFLDGGFFQDDTFNFYPCTFFENRGIQHAILRMVRDPRQNELSQNEVRILHLFSQDRNWKKFSPYLPNLLDAFLYENGVFSHQAAVFERAAGWCSLEDVHREYALGVDPKDMAWIWRRLLVVLGFAHANQVVHGAVLPHHIWIEPEQHGLILNDWFHAAQEPCTTGQTLSNIEPAFTDWYPEELFNGELPTLGTDISMSAKCMIYLLGGDAETGTIPDTIPNPLKMFLKGCILPGKRAPQDAWAVKQDFDDLLERLWGARTFHPFHMNNPIG